MKKNRLGKSDLYVSEAGFGSMSLPADDAEAVRIVHTALDAGINFIDTADLYGRGRIEELIGKAVKGRRESVILATKVGNRWNEGTPGWHWDPSSRYIKDAVKASLRRMGTDYIDLYQLHGGTIEDDYEDTVQAFEDLQAEGYIRWYGISSIRPNVIRRFVEHTNIVSVMMQYNILDRRPEECCLDFLCEHDVSVIARGPVASGLLSESVEQRVTDTGYLDYTKEELLAFAQCIKSLTTSGRSLVELALRYPLTHPAIATVIPGASRMEQLVQNIAAFAGPDLSSTELQQIQRCSKPVIYHHHR